MGGKQTVQIVTDSTADIPPELARAAGIRIVPLSIRFGEETYLDGVNLSGEQFYKKLSEYPRLPTTSAPPPGAFLDAYREAIAQDRHVISIQISAAVSATHNSAVLAAAECPPGTVTVVDSRNCSMAAGWVALMAAEEAKKGASVEQVKALVDNLLPRAHLYAVLGTLENLRRGGRIGLASAFLGAMLSIKPIVTLANGVVAPVQKVRLLDRALERLVEIAKEHAPLTRLAVAQTEAPKEMEQLLRLVERAFPGMDIVTYRAGAIVGALAGPGAVALVFIGAR